MTDIGARISAIKEVSEDIADFAKSVSADIAETLKCERVFLVDCRGGTKKLLGSNYDITDSYLSTLEVLESAPITRFPNMRKYDGKINFDDILDLFQKDHLMKNCGFVELSDIDGNPILLMGLADFKVNIRPKCHEENKEYFETILHTMYPSTKPSPIPEGMDEVEYAKACAESLKAKCETMVKTTQSFRGLKKYTNKDSLEYTNAIMAFIEDVAQNEKDNVDFLNRQKGDLALSHSQFTVKEVVESAQALLNIELGLTFNVKLSMTDTIPKKIIYDMDVLRDVLRGNMYSLYKRYEARHLDIEVVAQRLDDDNKFDDITDILSKKNKTPSVFKLKFRVSINEKKKPQNIADRAREAKASAEERMTHQLERLMGGDDLETAEFGADNYASEVRIFSVIIQADKKHVKHV